MTPQQLARFVAKLDKDSGCWLWRGAITSAGYGSVSIAGRMCSAHRVAYEHFVGPIPDGRELDHLCRVKECVNPDHLEAVTHAVNMYRGDLALRKRTHCPSGHPYDETNTRHTPRGERLCKTCIAARMSRYHASRKAA